MKSTLHAAANWLRSVFLTRVLLPALVALPISFAATVVLCADEAAEVEAPIAEDGEQSRGASAAKASDPEQLEPAETPAAGSDAAVDFSLPSADMKLPTWNPPTLPGDSAVAEGATADEQQAQRDGPRALLELGGVDQSHFMKIIDDVPYSTDEQEVMLKILYRVGRFDLKSIFQWTQRTFDWSQLAREPRAQRAEMFQLVGRVRQVTIEKPPAEVVQQYELAQYYLCEMEVGESRRPALVITPQVPSHWPRNVPIDERASAAGLFFKTGGEVAGQQQLVFLAPRLAWHPDRVEQTPATNLGMTILGDLGMDVGLYDDVRNRSKITSQDREAFYQLLWAVEQAGTAQLVRYAERQLADQLPRWEQQQQQLAEQIDQLRQTMAEHQAQNQPAEALRDQLKQTRLEQAILERMLEQGARGTYSIYPLFNQPEQQQGQLVMLQGTARRAIKVHVGSTEEGLNSDILARYGIDHYYEIELFTGDSENNPLVFCVRHLPAGFPEGDNINENVRLAGFFFKTWAFQTQKGMTAGPDGQMRTHQQLAPLLVGREPLWVQGPTAPRDSLFGIIAAGLFVAALVGIGIGMWRFTRSDEHFREQTIAKHYELDQGTSLDNLGIEADDKPDFSHLE